MQWRKRVKWESEPAAKSKLQNGSSALREDTKTVLWIQRIHDETVIPLKKSIGIGIQRTIKISSLADLVLQMAHQETQIGQTWTFNRWNMIGRMQKSWTDPLLRIRLAGLHIEKDMGKEQWGIEVVKVFSFRTRWKYPFLLPTLT